MNKKIIYLSLPTHRERVKERVLKIVNLYNNHRHHFMASDFMMMKRNWIRKKGITLRIENSNPKENSSHSMSLQDGIEPLKSFYSKMYTLKP